MFDRRNNLSTAVADDVRACLGTAVFETVVPRNVRLVRGAEPRAAGADLRPQMPRLRGLCPPCARVDRPSAATGGGGMSADRPAKGLGMGLQALLGEAARPVAAPAAERRPSRAAACARSKSRGSAPNPEPAAHPVRRGGARRARRVDPRSAACFSRSCCGPRARIIMIIAGERRWRAAQRARLHAIPAIVREIDESTTAELALIENIQRQDLNRDRGGGRLPSADPAPRPHPGRGRPDRPQVAKPRR